MKIKTLTITLGVVLLAYTGAIFGSSLYVEKKYNEKLDKISADLESKIDGDTTWRIIDRHYERGLFDSTARFVLEFDSKEGDKVKINVDHKIRTGPWLGMDGIGLAKVHSILRFDDASVNALQLGGADFADLQSVITYWGSLDLKANISPLNATTLEGSKLQFAGASLDLKGKSFGKTVDIDFQLPAPGLLITDTTGEKLSIGATTFQVTDALANQEMFLFSGSQNFNLASFELVHPQDNIDIKLTKAQALSTGLTEKGLYSLNQTMVIEGTYGGKPVRMDYEERWANLHLENITKLIKVINDGPESVENYNDMLQDVLKSGPSLSIRPFTVTYGNEVLDMDISVSFGRISKDEKKIPLQMLFLNKFKFELGATIPASFVESGFFAVPGGGELSAEIKKGVRKGMVVYDERSRSYWTNMSFGNGSFTVNGKTQRLF